MAKKIDHHAIYTLLCLDSFLLWRKQSTWGNPSTHPKSSNTVWYFTLHFWSREVPLCFNYLEPIRLRQKKLCRPVRAFLHGKQTFTQRYLHVYAKLVGMQGQSERHSPFFDIDSSYLIRNVYIQSYVCLHVCLHVGGRR